MGAIFKAMRVLPFDVDQIGQNLIAGGDDFRIGLKSALGGDQLDEFSGQVDIGHFKTAGGDGAYPGRIGGRDHRLAGGQR